jgi:predicted metalloenzyme YecM
MTLGLDISTTVVGIAMFDNENKICNLEYIKFKQKATLFEKLKDFINHFEVLSDALKLDDKEVGLKHISIEEPLKAFKGKFSNADTIQKLTMMNAMISGYLYVKFGLEPRYYNVQTARKQVFPDLKIPQGASNKKYLVWEKVVEREPQINWKYSKRTHKLMQENFDMSDAYIAGMCDIKVRELTEKSK